MPHPHYYRSSHAQRDPQPDEPNIAFEYFYSSDTGVTTHAAAIFTNQNRVPVSLLNTLLREIMIPMTNRATELGGFMAHQAHLAELFPWLQGNTQPLMYDSCLHTALMPGYTSAPAGNNPDIMDFIKQLRPALPWQQFSLGQPVPRWFQHAHLFNYWYRHALVLGTLTLRDMPALPAGHYYEARIEGRQLRIYHTSPEMGSLLLQARPLDPDEAGLEWDSADHRREALRVHANAILRCKVEPDPLTENLHGLYESHLIQ